MPLSKAEKDEVRANYARSETDSGSTEVQIAMLTRRILQLSEHLKAHKHDNGSRHGLLKMVGQRRRLLAYLRDTRPDSYQSLIQRLGLRR